MIIYTPYPLRHTEAREKASRAHSVPTLSALGPKHGHETDGVTGPSMVSTPPSIERIVVDAAVTPLHASYSESPHLRATARLPSLRAPDTHRWDAFIFALSTNLVRKSAALPASGT